MPYLQRLKITLQSKRFIILSLVFIIVYVLITTKWITYESKLDENTTQITGNIISYTIDGNKLSLLIKEREKIQVTYYINTLEDWASLNTLGKDFYVALSLYKSGKVDQYAGKGENEWLEESNIIKKQILISRNIKNYKGFYIFRYEYLFNIHNNENLNKEIENLKTLIDNS